MKRTRRFPHAPTSVGDAREFATDALSGTVPEVLGTIELMVSELATNCIRHAGTAFDVTVSRTAGEIRIEVTDRSAVEPALRSPGPEDATGRGLQIVALLSGAWGIQRSEGHGKTVWFTVTDHQPADASASGAFSEATRSRRRPKTLGSEMSLIRPRPAI
jgi:anti-sigma regulatory factor (Ser/Thr protein kinase)